MSSKFKLQSSKLTSGKLIFAALFLPFALSTFGISANAQKVRPIGEIQGDKNSSPFEGEQAKISGIVTARTRTGFFVQTPDGKTDNNPATSEGIFVFTKTEPSAEASIGNLVSVTGEIKEYRPNADPKSLPLTQLSMTKDKDTISVESKNNALPKPIVLTAADFKSGAIDALERYEGMRVEVRELTVTAPTGGRVDGKNASSESNGVFYGVVKGLARPFRERGFDAYDFAMLDEKDKEKFKKDYPKMPIFDNNAERLRIESAAQLDSKTIETTALATLKNLTGVLNYSYRAYTILVDANYKPEISGSVKASPLPATTARQFSVAGMNIENFFDDQDDPAIREDIVSADGFERRLKKISKAIREYMMMPDVVGIIEAENQTALQRLADRINKDAVAAGKADPKYEAFVIDGNDGRGIDSGFLIKSSRVKKIEIQQFGKAEKFKNASGGEEVFLNDRPPLMLRASINDPKTNQPFEFTVVANHLKSFLGYNDPKQSDNVRLKKRLQAEFLAKWVQDRQTKNPSEKIILLGDFNAYQFNDGIVDQIGTITGKPAAKGEVMNPSEDFVNPDLIDLVDRIKADQRYSYSFDGNAQVLDHIIVNEAMNRYVYNFGYVRLNSDFPESLRSDDQRVERFSDHDAAIAYFTFDESKKK